MQKKINLTSSRILELNKKKRKNIRNKIFLFLFLLILLFISLFFLSKIERINIKTINIYGNKVIEDKVILNIVEEELNSNYLWILSKRVFFFYPKNKIENELKDNLKRIEDVNISIENFNTLNIYLSEISAKYIWCGDFITNDSLTFLKDKCYFVNQEGYIFDKAPFFSGNVYFKFFGLLEENEDQNPLGKYFAQEIFSDLIFLYDRVLSLKLEPYAFHIKEDKDIELYLSSEKSSLEEYPKILFKMNFDRTQIAENLQSIINSEPLKTKLKENYSSLEYIDLRFGNKIFYKFK